MSRKISLINAWLVNNYVKKAIQKQRENVKIKYQSTIFLVVCYTSNKYEN